MYRACVMHVSWTYLDVSQIQQDTSGYNKIHLQIRTSLDTIEIHVSHYVSLMYPACIVNAPRTSADTCISYVSRMYPACILTCKMHIYPDLSDMYPKMYLGLVWDTCEIHAKCQDTCILLEFNRACKIRSGYIKIHQDTCILQDTRRIHQDTYPDNKPPKLDNKPPAPQWRVVFSLCCPGVRATSTKTMQKAWSVAAPGPDGFSNLYFTCTRNLNSSKDVAIAQVSILNVS